MSRRTLIVLVAILVQLAPDAHARGRASKRSVPLLPEPESTYVAWSASRWVAATPTRPEPMVTNGTLEAALSPEPTRSTSLGLELGTVARKTNANSDALGLQMLYGGRVFLRMPLTRNIYIKPALGYFRKSEGTSQTGVTQNAIEAGGAAHYVLNPTRKLRWAVGAAARLETLFSTISAFNASDTTPLAFRLRLGPVAGFAYSIDKDVSLTSDLELGFSFTRPVRPYAGLTMGVFFRLF